MALLVLLACSSSGTVPLIDIPEVLVTPASVTRGDPVQLQVRNNTASEVILPPPVCATRLEQYSNGQWFEVPFPNPTCVGVEVSIPIGSSHQFAFPTMPDRSGRFRALVHGSTSEGTFVVRSPTFTVE